ncbi:MAG: glycosyltransferase family 39 protein [bacterium]
MAAVFLATTVLLLSQQAGGEPIIRAGREAEIRALFSDCDEEETKGWYVRHLHIPYNRIRATFLSRAGQLLVLELSYRGGSLTAPARTPSFDIRPIERKGLDREAARRFARAVARCVTRNDSGTFWRWAPDRKYPWSFRGLGWRVGGGRLNLRRGSSTPRWESFIRGEPDRPWSLGERVTVAWAVALWGFLLLIAWAFLRQRPWRGTEGRLALLEASLLTGLALLVRWWIVTPGPANFYTRLTMPFAPRVEFPPYGPGFDGWIQLWYHLLGGNETAVFFAGALAGALTVIPVYVIGWVATERRLAGTLGAIVLALWPVHARLSTTDDSAGLIALLVTCAVALVLAAGRAGSHLYLLAGWLAAGLAATVRPEPALCFAPLALLVLLGPTSRRLQLRPWTALATALLIGLTAVAVYVPVTMATSIFSPWDSLQWQHLRKLLGAEGGSLLGPPRTSLLLTALVVVGLPFAWRALRWRVILLTAIGFVCAVPTTVLNFTDFITARYQLPLVVLSAAIAGMGLAGSAQLVGPRLGRARLVALPVAGMLLAGGIAWGVVRPPPEPTFRLEYWYFSENLSKVPERCSLVRPYWGYDLGLAPPVHLTRLRSTRHLWLRASRKLDPEHACLVYWRPASCRAVGPGQKHRRDFRLPDCALIESSFRLVPIAETRLPARTGLCERYLDDPVRVGFYRLRKK